MGMGNHQVYQYYLIRYEGIVRSKDKTSKSYYTEIVKGKTMSNAILNAKKKSAERTNDWYTEKPIQVLFKCDYLGRKESFSSPTKID